MRPVIICGPMPGPGAGAVGGVAVHTHQLAAHLRHDGRRVRVMDDTRPFEAEETGDVLGVRGAAPADTLRIALSHPVRAAGILVRALAGRHAVPGVIPPSTAFTRSLLIAETAHSLPDAVLHIQQTDYRPLYARWAGAGQPLVIAVHGLWLLQAPVGRLPVAVAQRNLSHAAAVVTPSHALAAEVATLGVPAERVRVIPNGVDHAIFRPRDREACREALGLEVDGALAVYVGRLTTAKGVGDLLEAWSGVSRGLRDATLALVGPDEEALAGRLPGVIAPGPVPPETAALWLGAADVVVVPSHYEGFGLSALEAMASARPVVATRVGGLAEVVSDDIGSLVPPHEPDALARAVLEMLSDPVAAREAGSAAAVAATAYSWEAAADAYGRLYDDL